MRRLSARLLLICRCWICFALIASALADGKVFPEKFAPKIETPNQRALIHHADGVERLVIETSLLGAGTNFAWVVPLPSPPEIKPVSENFFQSLESAFESRLIHGTRPYYAGILLICGLIFLSWRSFNLALVILFSIAWSAFLIFLPRAGFRLMVTLGSDYSDTPYAVSVVSVQRAGVFESTTIRSSSGAALFGWLGENGYALPQSAESIVQRYAQNGWVFVASKVRRDVADNRHTALHPLSFTFPSKNPIYPTQLTAVENGDCAMDLFVFGNERATARHFTVERCDARSTKQSRSPLRISDSEILEIISGSSVGTKLSGRLTPKQMGNDVEIKWERFRPKLRTVFSQEGAAQLTLNFAIPIAAIGWLVIGSSAGGWGVNEGKIAKWRRCFLLLTLFFGLLCFVLLPKVEIERISQEPYLGEE